MEETTNGSVKERLGMILSAEPNDTSIEIVLVFDNGHVPESHDEAERWDPPTAYIIVRAEHETWLNLPFDTFSFEEVPLLLGEVQDTGLVSQAADEAVRVHEDEMEYYRFLMAKSKERLQVAKRVIYVYHFIVVEKQTWKPVACGRSHSYTEFGKQARQAGFPHSHYALAAVHPATYKETVKGLQAIN